MAIAIAHANSAPKRPRHAPNQIPSIARNQSPGRSTLHDRISLPVFDAGLCAWLLTLNNISENWTMETKHTPGPWRYCPQNGSPTTGQHMIAGGLPGYLAEVRDCGSGDVKANARLIAAAPDLLAALEQCADIIDDNYERLGYACAPVCVRKARDAIAKATNT